jgi:hypothetical protein
VTEAYNALKRNAPLRSPDLAISLTALAAIPAAAALEVLAGAERRARAIVLSAGGHRQPDERKLDIRRESW